MALQVLITSNSLNVYKKLNSVCEAFYPVCKGSSQIINISLNLASPFQTFQSVVTKNERVEFVVPFDL